jgi:phenylacetate-coenzyme A ligase PaaK-like adenylate-forming protein
LNVYRLDDESVASYFDAIRSRPGAVIIGYTSAIRKLLNFVERSGIDGAAAQVRAVSFCGESVSRRDFDRVSRLLACPSLVEYGMQETGVMAYSRPGRMDLEFLWDAYHCWITSDRELVVTSLQPVRFPLINYGTEDRIELLDCAVGTLPFRCMRIAGRTREVLSLTLKGGRSLEAHSEIIVDVLDSLSTLIRSYFIHQKADIIDIAIKVASGHELDTVRDGFIREIRREFPDIDETKFTFSHLDRERLTVAGKRKYVVRE